jgi:hypothetical protein
VFFDGFDTEAATSNINQDLTTRQGGAIPFSIPGGVTYLASTPDPTNDYRHQMFGNPSPLQLAGNFGGWGPNLSTLVSPTYNFVGMLGGEMVGKQISFNVDTFYNNPGAANDPPFHYAYTAITVAANNPLEVAGVTSTGFSVRFEEADFGAGAYQTINFYDGTTLVGQFANPAGTGGMLVNLFIDDAIDSNPWDGIGSTTIGVAINGNPPRFLHQGRWWIHQ